MKGEKNHFLQEEKQNQTSNNNRNGYTPKSVARNHGTVRVICQCDRRERLALALFPSTHVVSRF